MSGATRRVLIVDDSPAMRQLLVFTLRRFPGVTVDQAGDGVAALKAIQQAASPYELVFLDLNMPVMDGMKVLGRLSEDPSFARTAVAVITTEERAESEEQARRLGARYFVRKPVNRRAIESIVDEVFGAGGTGGPER